MTPAELENLEGLFAGDNVPTLSVRVSEGGDDLEARFPDGQKYAVAHGIDEDGPHGERLAAVYNAATALFAELRAAWKEIALRDELGKASLRGFSAYLDGLPETANPHPDGYTNEAWHDGWHEGRCCDDAGFFRRIERDEIELLRDTSGGIDTKLWRVRRAGNSTFHPDLRTALKALTEVKP